MKKVRGVRGVLPVLGVRGVRGVLGVLAVLVVLVVLVVSAVPAAGQQQALAPVTDTAAVERGQKLLVDQCGFCHGANARGGSGGPDLTRSAVVQNDESGKQLGDFLAAGRRDRGRPKFDRPPAQVSDLASFLPAAISQNSNRRLYKILDIVVGDARAGEAYFNGAGRCTTCHSPSGDLKGVGGKYEPAVLQGRLLLPRGRERAPNAPPVPLYADPSGIKVTVTTASGGPVTGGLVRLTDFEVTLFEEATGRMHSWLRNGDTPKVSLTDPLQGHLDQLPKWTDPDMHNMTAYLAGLK